MNEPTEAEINRGIAEWMFPDGLWVIVKRGLLYRPNGHGYTHNESEAWKLAEAEADQHIYPQDDEPVTKRRCVDPSYTTSHDACHQALERMTEEQVLQTCEELASIMEDDRHLHAMTTLRATAQQKAIAIYRVVKGEGR